MVSLLFAPGIPALPSAEVTRVEDDLPAIIFYEAEDAILPAIPAPGQTIRGKLSPLDQLLRRTEPFDSTNHRLKL